MIRKTITGPRLRPPPRSSQVAVWLTAAVRLCYFGSWILCQGSVPLPLFVSVSGLCRPHQRTKPAMKNVKASKIHPHVPFLYEMAKSFFETARLGLDPLLEDIDGYQKLALGKDGRPLPPERVSRKFGQLSRSKFFGHVGGSLAATTNLGLAYVHTLRLLSFLTQQKDALPRNANNPNLPKLYDALPDDTQKTINKLFNEVDAHDFHLEVSAGSFPEDRNDETPSGGSDLRSALTKWQAQGMLQDSHLSLTESGVIRVFIPLKAVLVLGSIFENQIAPTLGIDYKPMDKQMSSRTEDPQLEWDGERISVSLPDKLGRTFEASWVPAVTSVVRIRESGTQAWSPGFETPFNKCTFIDLKPDTEYDVQLTHKNDAGESEPAISSFKTAPSSK